MRLFFALWPPAGTAQALAVWASALAADTGGRVTVAANIHLTLAFLGAVDDPERAGDAGKAVGAAAHALPIEQARYWKHNRIVWAGPAATPPALAALAERLRLELYRREFILERRPFAAHVTLLRKAEAPVRPLPALPQVEWPVREFLLVRSRTAGSGPVYEPLERFALS